MARDSGTYRWIACTGLLVATAAMAAELQPRTDQAYDGYVRQATERFLTRVADAGPPSAGPGGAPAARPGSEDGIIGVPGGLVHHWAGAVLLRDERLEEVLAVACSYDAYDRIYRSVVASRLVGRQADDAYRVQMRLRESEAGVSAVLDVLSTVQYVRLTATRAYSVSTATEIREVKDAGRRDERLLPPGRDSGYLWRANTFSYFEQRTEGVYVQMETLGLSRRFPPLLGWMIEPIARRVGRRSIERSLAEFQAAVTARRIAAGPCANPAATAQRSDAAGVSAAA
jgi:hypothetical protein